jgi:hypothetical protein
MLTEQCVACGTDVPLSGAVHMLVNPKEGEDVSDGYLCRGCYEEHVEPILPPGESPVGDGDERAGDEEPSGDAADGEPAGDDDATVERA